MLMYLATNSRPYIAYSVNQCARLNHIPKQSHAVGVKRILRYLRGIRTKGIHINPTGVYNVDCFVDTDFGGIWGSENKQNPISVKSRTGFGIMFTEYSLL